MTAKIRAPKRRPDMRKAVFLFPSGLTLLNLFFGVFANIAASRLEFTTAGVYVVLGGICDALDGRVARATNAGSQFGEELDSLVDAITFGLAPGMIMYFAVLNRGGWDWVWVFAFAAAAVLRLARFNIEQAGTAKTYFQGLPSPAAGITLASYYWFSESWLYNYGRIANLNWHFTLRVLMAVLAALMISNVPYPTFPRTGFRSIRAIGSSIIVFGAFALLLTGKLEYFFPIAVLYVTLGLLRWMLSGLFERRQPTLPYDLSEGEDEEDEEEEEELELVNARIHASRPSHRDEAASRPERVRGRPDRAEMDTRPERGPRKPERPPRAERPERPEAAERAPDDERARRDKKKDRPKRPDRPERPERQPRPPRPETAPASPMVAAAPVTTGVDAITLGEPDVGSAEDDAIEAADETELESGADVTTPGPEGATPRKRKRRRRRGERKERAPGDATARSPDAAGSPTTSSAESAGDAGSSQSEVDHSPYAAGPSAYAPPVPPSFTPAAPPASPPPLPSAPPSSNEPSE
jgi:CDP-diacylglycerol--serine O-phosphatidyltransferase